MSDTQIRLMSERELAYGASARERTLITYHSAGPDEVTRVTRVSILTPPETQIGKSGPPLFPIASTERFRPPPVGAPREGLAAYSSLARIESQMV